MANGRQFTDSEEWQGQIGSYMTNARNGFSYPSGKRTLGKSQDYYPSVCQGRTDGTSTTKIHMVQTKESRRVWVKNMEGFQPSIRDLVNMISRTAINGRLPC